MGREGGFAARILSAILVPSSWMFVGKACDAKFFWREGGRLLAMGVKQQLGLSPQLKSRTLIRSVVTLNELSRTWIFNRKEAHPRMKNHHSLWIVMKHVHYQPSLNYTQLSPSRFGNIHHCHPCCPFSSELLGACRCIDIINHYQASLSLMNHQQASQSTS